MQTTRQKISFLTQFGILLAIEVIVCFTPLGSLPALGPLVATLGAVPVVVTAIVLGAGPGTLMGAFFGLFSFLVWTFLPPAYSVMGFVFTPFYPIGNYPSSYWSLVICFVPRILVGLVTGLCFKGFSRLGKGKKGEFLAFAASGALGSLVNTFGVLGGIYLFFGPAYADAIGQGYHLLLGLLGLQVLTNGLPEAVICAVTAYFVCRPLLTIQNKKRPHSI